MSLNTGNSILSNAINVSSTYNVGIGATADASYKLLTKGNVASVDSNGQNTIFLSAGTSVSYIDTSYIGGGSYVPLAFGTGGSERMRITSGGNVLIGTTSDNGSKLNVNGTIYSSAYRINDTGGGYVTLGMQNTERWSINYLGRFAGYGAGTLTTDGNGFITASSDRNLKDIIKPLENVLDKIINFEPVYFKWNDKTDLDKENIYISTIAQSIEKDFPEAVGKMADGTLTVQDRAVMAILVKAIQEQQAIINDLQNKVETLLNK